MTNQLTLSRVTTEDGWTIELNSPITFDVVEEWDEANKMTWQLARVTGFDQVSSCLAEKTGELIDWVIPNLIQGVLSHAPDKDCEDCANDTPEVQEGYKMFYNYLKNSIERITVKLPANLRYLVGTQDGPRQTMELEIV